MKILLIAEIPYLDSGALMTEIYRQRMSSQLARVIVFNLACLALFVALCAVLALGSPSLMGAYWHQHRAASIIVSMILIVAIPGLAELILSRWGLWRT